VYYLADCFCCFQASWQML